MREVSTVAAYRDRWHVTGRRPIGTEADAASIEQNTQRQRAQAAVVRAVAIGSTEREQPTSAGIDLQVETQRGVER